MRQPRCCILIFCSAALVASGQTFKVLATLNGNGDEGASTYYETLTQGTDGNVYGTAVRGGASTACEYNCGTIFCLSSASGPSGPPGKVADCASETQARAQRAAQGRQA